MTRRDSGEVDLSLFLEENGWKGETKITWYPEDGPEAQMIWDLVTRLKQDASSRAAVKGPKADPRGLAVVGPTSGDLDS